MMKSHAMDGVGIVVIGRNEGQRLVKCLDKLSPRYKKIVYVDSGSTDDSVKYTQSLDILVIELATRPFGAGRARNAGFNHLLSHFPDIKYVQFVDGDCELDEEWMPFAQQHLKKNPAWAVVCGRLKECHPDVSVYNLLCDMEWDTPVGQTKSLGGIFMIRVSAFQAAQGFNADLIAGEEPELGFRLRELGWQLWRLDHLMATHDANLTKFFQWWKRMQRSGYAYAQGFFLHGRSDEKYCVHETLRIWAWAVLIPITIIVFSIGIHPFFSFLIMIYPVQVGRVARKQYRKTGDASNSFIYAIFNLIGKFPEFIGQIRFWARMILRRKAEIIEYKL